MLLLDHAASMKAVKATAVPDGDWVAAVRAVDGHPALRLIAGQGTALT